MRKSEKLKLPAKPPCLLSSLIILMLWITCINALSINGGGQDDESNARFKGYYGAGFDQIGNQMDKRFLGYSLKSNPGRRSNPDAAYFRDNRFLGYPSQRSSIGKRFLGAGNIKRFRLIPHVWGEEGKRVPMTNDFLGKRKYVEEEGSKYDIDQDDVLLADVANYMRHWYPQYLTGGSFYFKRDGFGRANRLQTNDFLG